MLSPNEIKELLVEEHKKEIKITVIRNAVILLIASVVVYLIYTYAFKQTSDYFQGVRNFFDQSKNSGTESYVFVISSMLLSAIGYFIYDIITVVRRSAKIDEFIEKVESGKVAASILDNSVYKVIVPLGKTKLMLCPMNFVNVGFIDERRVYKFPIPAYAISDLKVLLSGVKAEDLGKGEAAGKGKAKGKAKAWYELYDGVTTKTSEKSELKSIAEFQKFADTDLKSEIESVETNRAKTKKTWIKFLVPGTIVMLGWFGFQYGLTTGKIKMDTKTILTGFVGACVLIYGFMFIVMRSSRNKPMMEDFGMQFKTKIFNRIIHYINPDFRYVLHGHISLAEFLETGFFENKRFALGGNDQIIGKHSGVPFQLCDLNVDYERTFSRENEGPDEVFFGQIFIAKFNKEFKNDVYIIPNRVEGAIFSKSDTSSYLDNLGDKVKLEDPEFSKMFTVYSEDQIEARYILSTALMERIKRIAKDNPKGKYMISFRNNRISIANNSRLNNFEVSMFKSITKNNQVVEFYEELTNQLKIIDDLKLNVNIWKS